MYRVYTLTHPKTIFSYSHTHTDTAPSVSPEELSVSHFHPTTAELTWSQLPMEERNGVITGYTVQVVGPDASQNILIQGSDTTSVEVTGLRTFTSYAFNVSAITKAGTGPEATFSSTTPEGGKTLIP